MSTSISLDEAFLRRKGPTRSTQMSSEHSRKMFAIIVSTYTIVDRRVSCLKSLKQSMPSLCCVVSDRR